jgi:hypothetical protein
MDAKYKEVAKYTFNSIFDKYRNQSSQIKDEKLFVVEQRYDQMEKDAFRLFSYFAEAGDHKYCLTQSVSDAKKIIQRDIGILTPNEQLLYKYRLLELIKRDVTDKETEYGCMFDRDEVYSLYKWIREQLLNVSIENQPESQQYIFDIGKITTIYNFCIDTGVISNSISNVNFINAVNNADFKNVFANAEQQKAKSKCKYIIYVLSHTVSAESWYQNTARSINTEPNKCSGINVPSDWKRQANALK